jgi:hypothetical protein
MELKFLIPNCCPTSTYKDISVSKDSIMTERIPGPKSLPFVGNLLDLVDDEAPLRALEHLAETYGPIYKLTRQGNKVIIVSSVEIMEGMYFSE